MVTGVVKVVIVVVDFVVTGGFVEVVVAGEKTVVVEGPEVVG